MWAPAQGLRSPCSGSRWSRCSSGLFGQYVRRLSRLAEAGAQGREAGLIGEAVDLADGQLVPDGSGEDLKSVVVKVREFLKGLPFAIGGVGDASAASDCAIPHSCHGRATSLAVPSRSPAALTFAPWTVSMALCVRRIMSAMDAPSHRSFPSAKSVPGK